MSVCGVPLHTCRTLGTEPSLHPICRFQVCMPSAGLGEDDNPGRPSGAPLCPVLCQSCVTRDTWGPPPSVLLHLHSHQQGSTESNPEVLSQPLQEEKLSALDLPDVEEVQISRDTCWPDSEAEPKKSPSFPHPHEPRDKVDQNSGALKTLLRSFPHRYKCGKSFGQESSLDQPTGQL